MLLLLPSTRLRVTGCFGYTGYRDPTSASRIGDDTSSGGGSSDQPVTVNIAEQGGKIDPLGKVVKAVRALLRLVDLRRRPHHQPHRA